MDPVNLAGAYLGLSIWHVSLAFVKRLLVNDVDYTRVSQYSCRRLLG